LAKQLQAKAAEMAAAAALLFSDLQAVGRFKGKVEELENYMVDYSNSQYSDWCEEVERDLQDEASGLPMQLTGKLMEVDRDDADKLLRVNFSDRLVRFLREVRLLSSLGFKMTPLVQGNADVAHKFYRHGVVLKQVANFYNTIDTQIVNSQKPLLLDHALRFEQLATTPKAQQTANAAGGGKEITWSDPTQLEGYIDELRGCSEELMQENRKLRQVHRKMGEQVCTLMETSLLRKKSAWEEQIKKLRAQVEELQPRYPGMKGWRMHWDMQLFKALEHQYQLGLEGLHTDLPQITCDLEFKARRLQLRPPLEDLRTEFYREIKKFIAIPPSFKGLGYFEEAKGGADKDGKAPPPKHKVLKIFRDMPERNHASLMLVYRRAAELFSKVEALIAKYRPWVAIGLHEGSLDDLVDACATEAADFEANFKVLKAKRKEAEKLPATEKVDCITVNLAPFKAAVDDQQQRLTDALLYGMRRLSDTKKAEVDEFIAASMETLSRRPQSVDEIGTAKKEWREIVQNKEGVKGTLKKLEELGRQMRGVSKHGIELGPIMSKWEELELTLDAFNERVEEQMSHLRGQMDGRVKELQLKVSKFAARWNELKPKKLEAADPEAMAAVIARVKEWEEEFGDLEVTTERIAQDCHVTPDLRPHIPRYR
jgi:dynein heavy chain 2